MLENLASINLFRHGQAGPRDAYDTLSELGVEEAQALGTYLVRSEIEFDILMTGPLLRQRKTAELVRQTYVKAARSIPTLTVDDRWAEFDLGEVYAQSAARLSADDARFRHEFEQMRVAIESGDAEVHRGHNYCDAAVIRAWVDARYPYTGESWADFRERVLLTITDIPSDRDLRVGIFTSATPISIWAANALELDVERLWKLAAVSYNTGVTTLQTRSNGDLRLESFNALPHLQDTNNWTLR